jgi:hypothetical protein
MASSRTPFWPATVVAATGWSSSKRPSTAIVEDETMPPPKLITKTWRLSGLIAAQQTSLRVSATDPLTSDSRCEG